MATNDSATQIRPHLYVGGINDVRDDNLLHKLGITHLLSVAAEYPPSPWLGRLETLHVPLYDRTNECTEPHFATTYAFIEKARTSGGCVLVHCQYGISRSVTIVLAYLMQQEHVLLSTAFEEVHAKRSISEPNPGFLQELRDWEKSLFGSISSTDRLTILDTGPLDLSSEKAQVEQLFSKSLAMAGRTDTDELRNSHGRVTADAIAKCLEHDQGVILLDCIIHSFESFAGTSTRDQAAREALHKILLHIAMQSKQWDRVIRECIDSLGDTLEWSELCIDVPLAPLHLQRLKCVFYDAAVHPTQS